MSKGRKFSLNYEKDASHLDANVYAKQQKALTDDIEDRTTISFESLGYVANFKNYSLVALFSAP